VSFVRSPIDIVYPYKHSTGPLVGRALAALAAGRIIGARCDSCGVVGVPARDWCDRCGGSSSQTLPVGPGGVVTALVRVHEPTDLAPDIEAWALIRLDGADTDMVHAVRGRVEAGDRVHPVWRDERHGAITDIACFEPGEAAPAEDVEPGAPVEIFERTVSLPYSLTAGSLLSRFFTDVREHRCLHGVRCTSCGMVIVPPLPACATCWADTEGWIEVADRGTVTTFVVVNVPFHGQEMPLPYVLARILLDGADTSMLHVLGDVDPSSIRMGMRVEAVWGEQRTGYPADDIRFFRPTGEPDVPPGRFIDRL
jgi:uncharacterized OB-fold protein